MLSLVMILEKGRWSDEAQSEDLCSAVILAAFPILSPLFFLGHARSSISIDLRPSCGLLLSLARIWLSEEMPAGLLETTANFHCQLVTWRNFERKGYK